MKSVVFAMVALAALPAITGGTAHSKPFKELFPDTTFKNPEATKLAEGFDYQQGPISLPGIGVKMTVPADYYFFGEMDSRRMLTEVWGNPPSSASAVRGMLMPSNKTPLDDTWAAVITYDDDGYVSDEDAKNMDYADLLKTMQEGTAEASAERAKAGFGTMRLVGWASPPYYDPKTHKLHWAKEIEFDGKPNHTLNYDVRALGRKGVLKMNFVGDMKQLDEIQKVIPGVMAMPEFQQGFRYADYVPSTDKLAAYGIGGLIAGKVAAKLGLLALALAFLKKGFVLVLVAGAALLRGLKSLFWRGGSKPE
jgi:uncharacterized membrane-anchored protein